MAVAHPDPAALLRLPQIIGKPATKRAPAIPPLIPVSKSTWWAGVRSGRFPAPVKIGKRCTAWRRVDVLRLAGPDGLAE